MRVRYRLPQPYRDLEHTADVGVEVEGDSAAEALARLVLAESALLAGGGAVEPERDEALHAAGTAPVAIAVAALRELLFRFATERLLAASCEVVALDPHAGADLVVGLGRFDPDHHAEGLDLKAVTWHGARLEPRDGGGWVGRVVFDV